MAQSLYEGTAVVPSKRSTLGEYLPPVFPCLCGASREVLTAVIGNQTQNSTVVLIGSSAGGVGAFNVVSWLLDSFQQVHTSFFATRM